MHISISKLTYLKVLKAFKTFRNRFIVKDCIQFEFLLFNGLDLLGSK